MVGPTQELRRLKQRGQVDPKALGTGATGAGTALLGWLSIDEIALVVGIFATIITTVAYVWRVRRMTAIQERQRQDNKDHNEEMAEIARGRDE